MARFSVLLVSLLLVQMCYVYSTPIPTATDSGDTQTVFEDGFAATTLPDVDVVVGGDDDDDVSTLQPTTTTMVDSSGIEIEDGVDESNIIKLKSYLEKFGYVPPGSTFTSATVNYTQAILHFQENGGINQTGVLDAATEELLNMSRCGVPDVFPESFVASSIKWPLNRAVTYSYGTLTSDIASVADVKADLRRAFQVWDDVSGLTFREVPDSPSVDIRISFGSYEHGDGIRFDGAGGVLAHAFLPRNGDAHFDESERWTRNTYSGTNLFQVAAHEFGHSLGLYHSNYQSALMYPYYRGYQPNFSLGQDDINGIRSLYGANTGSGTTTTTTRRPSTTTRRTTTTPPTTTTTTTTTTTSAPPVNPPPPSSACSGSFDSIIQDTQDRIYALSGNYYWRLDLSPPAWGYKTLRFGSRLPADIDASFQDGVTSYFFSGCYYYRQTATNRNFAAVPTNRRWVGIPCEIDAAFQLPNGQTYFLKDSFAYRFSSNDLLQRRTRITSMFRDVPAALTDGVEAVGPAGSTAYYYFFRDGLYYRMRRSDRRFVTFPDGSWYRNVVGSLLPQCTGLNYESPSSCSHSSE